MRVVTLTLRRERSVLGLGGDVIMVPYVDSFGNIRERQETVRRPLCRPRVTYSSQR